MASTAATVFFCRPGRMSLRAVLTGFFDCAHQTATTTYAHPRRGRSAEDGSSRVPLPSGRTPRPFAVRVPRGPHSTPPTVRAGPTPTVAGCSRAAPERPPPKGSHLAARKPSAPPIGPDPTTLRPRPDSPACFAIATPSPAPRPPSALRSRRLTTFQVQDAGSTPRARHRADADRVAMGWLVVHRWAPHRQDSLGLEFGMLRTSLPLVLPVDCVCETLGCAIAKTVWISMSHSIDSKSRWSFAEGQHRTRQRYLSFFTRDIF